MFEEWTKILLKNNNDKRFLTEPNFTFKWCHSLTTVFLFCFFPFTRINMYLENKSNLEMEMTQTSASGHQCRSSLRPPEAVAGNFGELRLLQGISENGDTQKLQQSSVLPSGQCVIHTEGFVPVRKEDRY